MMNIWGKLLWWTKSAISDSNANYPTIRNSKYLLSASLFSKSRVDDQKSSSIRLICTKTLNHNHRLTIEGMVELWEYWSIAGSWRFTRSWQKKHFKTASQWQQWDTPQPYVLWLGTRNRKMLVRTPKCRIMPEDEDITRRRACTRW